MTVSVVTGHTEAYPVYLSIGNLQNNLCRSHCGGVVVIAFLAIAKCKCALLCSYACQTIQSMPQLNPLPGAIPPCPHPVTRLVEWKTYSPPTPLSTHLPFERSLLVLSKQSKTVKKSITSQSLGSRTKSRDWNQLSRGTPRHTSKPLMAMSITPCT